MITEIRLLIFMGTVASVLGCTPPHLTPLNALKPSVGPIDSVSEDGPASPIKSDERQAGLPNPESNLPPPPSQTQPPVPEGGNTSDNNAPETADTPADKSYLKIEKNIAELKFDEINLIKFAGSLGKARQPIEYYDAKMEELVRIASQANPPPPIFSTALAELNFDVPSGLFYYRQVSYVAIRGGGKGKQIYGYGVTRVYCDASLTLTPEPTAELVNDLNSLNLCEGYKDPKSVSGKGGSISMKLPEGLDVQIGNPHMLSLYQTDQEMTDRDFKQLYWPGYKHKLICGDNARFARLLSRYLNQSPIRECAAQSQMPLDINEYGIW